jgi:hypothetical protein
VTLTFDAHQAKTLEIDLNRIISTCLCGPSGEPDSSHKWAAAYAWAILKKKGLEVYSEKEFEARLRPNESDNEDYLKWAMEDETP